MKVKCIHLLDARGQPVEFSPWLTLGYIYHVLAIYIEPDSECSYRIVTNEKKSEWPSMGYHSGRCFEIISDIIPSNWKVKIYKMSAISISPAAWQEPWFLEAFFDHDPKAYPIFEREREIILREDP